ncbi:MAG: transcriptional regulator [Rhizobiaceae bacterium MnEN-MB40S]|nr:MAG: transcriptional regulator [Rhizobiaceae bacterium MnEN-MB40S]
MKTLKIGIMSYEEMKAYTMAIAKGEHRRKPGEPKIWFTSIQSFARVLSEQNRELLALISQARPQSLQELENLTGRKVSNLSRTLRKMEDYGIVTLERGKQGRIRPHFPYTGFQLELPLPVSGEHGRNPVKAA